MCVEYSARMNATINRGRYYNQINNVVRINYKAIIRHRGWLVVANLLFDAHRQMEFE